MENKAWDRELERNLGAQTEERRKELEGTMWKPMPAVSRLSIFSREARIRLMMLMMGIFIGLILWGLNT
ncbi:MAG: hypothetical protein AAB389_03960 [Patescibacteria group bacterium]